MPNLYQLKKEFESKCKVAKWSPTDEQLMKIAQLLSSTRPSSISNAQSVIKQICPNAIFILTEGVDNSDLNTLIAMAIAAAKEAK